MTRNDVRTAIRSRGLVPALLPLWLAACGPPPAPERPLATEFPDADTVRVAPLAPGVRHAYVWLPRGPWAVHVVEVDERVCRPRIAAVKAGPPLEVRAPTSVLGDDAIAAINADFFLIPAGTPVGAHVRGGRVLIGPGRRPVYARAADGRHHLGGAALAGFAAVGSDTAVIRQVNRPPGGDDHHPPLPGLTLFDAWYGGDAPADSAGATVRVAADGTVARVHPPGEVAPLEAGHVALRAVGSHAKDWLRRRAAGDTVTWAVALEPAGAADAPAAEAVGGFPVLVEGGRGVLDEQAGVTPAFGEARHPRTAVGWDEAGRRLFLVVVDGRRPGYSAGMSLAELERLMLRLGATHALNLDGGGSTALALRGRVANRPSDPAGERPVANALALEGCR